MGVCTKERKGVAAEVLMATPCTNSLGGESGGQKHEGCGGRSACWKYAAVSGAAVDVFNFSCNVSKKPPLIGMTQQEVCVRERVYTRLAACTVAQRISIETGNCGPR